MHHCHYTRKNIGAACSIGSLKYSVLTEVSIIFHNGSNYYNIFL